MSKTLRKNIINNETSEIQNKLFNKTMFNFCNKITMKYWQNVVTIVSLLSRLKS